MRSYLILIISLFCFSDFSAQDTIEVADNTMKIGSLKNKSFYYGFAEGDQIIFSFSELRGKKIKEVEIIELPNSSKFMTFKTDFLGEKIINVTSTGGIFQFRFYNSAMSNRICQFNIKRITNSDTTKNFNTNVYWKTVYDTSYHNVQERYFIRKDTIIKNITAQVSKVHSVASPNGNKTTFNFTLPQNTITWSYYIGVNQEGQIALENANKELAKNISPYIAAIPGYGPVAAIALNATPYIARLQKGEDVDFYIVDNQNVNLFYSKSAFKYIKRGKVINDFSQMSSPLKGNLHFCLKNDNAITAITVSVNITAITVENIYGKRLVKKMKIKSQKVAYLKN